MSKMIDVLEQSIVQNFKHAVLYSHDFTSEQLYQSILTVPDADLKDAFSHLFSIEDVSEVAAALEIPSERIAEIKAGIALKDEMKLADTAKVVALCLAIETDTLHQIEVSDGLQDFLI